MKRLVLIFVLIHSQILSAQTRTDSILTEIRIKSLDSHMKFKFMKETPIEISPYKICESWSSQVNYLKENLNQSQINLLIVDSNATISIIGYICKLSKNNSKDLAMEIMKELIKSNDQYIESGCSDALTTSGVASFFLRLLTEENSFFNPEFRLRKREVRKIQNEITVAYYKRMNYLN